MAAVHVHASSAAASPVLAGAWVGGDSGRGKGRARENARLICLPDGDSGTYPWDILVCSPGQGTQLPPWLSSFRHTPPHLLIFTAAWRALQLLSCCSVGSVLSTQQQPLRAWAWNLRPWASAVATSPSLDGGGVGTAGLCCGWLAGDWALCAFIAACMFAQAGLYFMTSQVSGGGDTVLGCHEFHRGFLGLWLCVVTGTSPVLSVLSAPSVVYFMKSTSFLV